MTQWRKRGTNPEDLATLHPGIPKWIEPFLLGWVNEVASNLSQEGYHLRRVPNVELLLEYESRTREINSHAESFRELGASGLLASMGESDFLDFVDFLVFHSAEKDTFRESTQRLHELNYLLEQGGSEWCVGTRDGYASLEKRVPEGVSLAVNGTIQASGSAGPLLSEAWHAAFGKSPDPEEAYEKAIKAVEEAGVGVVSPQNTRATLGTMLSQMRQQGNWKLPLPDDSNDVVIQMIDALWKGQESRHGGNGYRKPTNEEAESAVLLAVPLVQWFSAGHLSRSAE